MWPSAPFQHRAHVVEAALPHWGQALFAGLTGSPTTQKPLGALAAPPEHSFIGRSRDSLTSERLLCRRSGLPLGEPGQDTGAPTWLCVVKAGRVRPRWR
jgi:hypothetical protein